MQISWNWLSEFVDLSSIGGPQGLAELLTARGLEVEEIHFLARGFEKVVSAKILERNPHPQADRLSLCKISIGAGEPLDVVCGAQNMKAGDVVVLAQIGAHLPNDLKIEQSKIRGVISNGMLCSEQELRLAESSEGIIILPASTPLGKPIAEILGRNDTLFTLKLTANRGDCLSHLGLAREIAAALGQKVRRPEAADLSGVLKAGKCPISVHLDVGQSAPQFFGCLIEGVKIGPSPEWLVRRLETLGSRSINNVVDATNLVLFELGHPMHAYDADRIEGSQIHVRLAKEEEPLPLLDGQTVLLDGTELVIADSKKAVGLAGVMGGGNSEVRPETTRLFLECAEFAPALVRRASVRHQRKTEAAHRFERGIDPQGLEFAISRLAQVIMNLAGGTVRAATSASFSDYVSVNAPISVPEGYFSSFLGVSDLSSETVEKLLLRLECGIEKKSGHWLVTSPSYRRDLSIKEDLAEEIARSIGYDKIPSTIPALTSQPRPGTDPASARAEVIHSAKEALARLGMMETINFAFASRAWLAGFGMTPTALVQNPLSEEHEALVPSLLPGVIRNSLDNWRHHFGSEPVAIRLFELRPTFHKAPGDASVGVHAKSETDTGVIEHWKLAIALSGPRFAGGLRRDLGEVDFFDLKAVIEGLFESLGTRGVRFQPLTASRKLETPVSSVMEMLHPGQSVEILAGNSVAGYFGLLHPGKAKDLKVREPLWIAELDWEVVAKMSRGAYESRRYKAWPAFPPMERDFALIVREDVTADKITQLALKAGKPLAKVAKVFDIYKGQPIAEGMTSVAVRVIFFNEGRSLQEAETEAASSQILNIWKKELGAELRS